MRRFLSSVTTAAAIAVIVLALAAAVAAALAWRDYTRFADRSLLGSGAATLWVEPGMSVRRIGERLAALGLIEHDWRWQVLVRLGPATLQAGEYRIVPGQSARELLRRLAQGDVVRHRFTIIEGWTLARLRGELRRDPRLQRTLDGVDDDELMRRLDCADCFAEGWFLPETYQFIRGESDFDLLRRAHLAMREQLAAAWAGRATGLPLESPEELLVLASLVEREARVADERARVAGVFVRRLERGMRLQTDPSVVYGIKGPFDGRIRRRHLRTDHPWNTYTRGGLPPTPIALPGVPAIEASAHPTAGDALYFVARGDGTHHFSATLAEHNQAVARYILGRE